MKLYQPRHPIDIQIELSMEGSSRQLTAFYRGDAKIDPRNVAVITFDDHRNRMNSLGHAMLSAACFVAPIFVALATMGAIIYDGATPALPIASTLIVSIPLCCAASCFYSRARSQFLEARQHAVMQLHIRADAEIDSRIHRLTSNAARTQTDLHLSSFAPLPREDAAGKLPDEKTPLCRNGITRAIQV